MDMIKKKSWNEFRNTGLLLFLNQFLHIFGWAIVLKIEDGEVKDVYPARCKFRGFDEKSTEEAYIKITKYMFENGKALKDEIEDDNK